MNLYQVIVNPSAGRGSAGRSIPLIEQSMQALGLKYHLVQTQRPGHAIELAHQAVLDHADVVVAAGGDGTSNEVINGLMQARNEGSGQQVAMGVLAIGRGNDFAYSMGVAAGVVPGCQVLAGDQRRMIDIGRAIGGLYPNGRYFGNGVGIGFDAVVGFEAAKLPLTGLPAYLVAALKTIFRYSRAPVLEVEYEDGDRKSQTLTQPFLMVSIMNGRRLGGGFMMAPDGQSDDGMFDLCLASQVSRPAMVTLILRFMQGTQASHPAIQTGRAERVHVRAIQGAIPAHADGETLCEAGEALTLELLPKMLEVVSGVNGSSR